jgi:hypothetical protein
MSALNRRYSRAALTALLETALVNSSLCEAVYGYQPSDFGGKSPVATVSSAGSMRVKQTRGLDKNEFYFNVHVFTLYSDGSTWNEDDAENAIDNIEAAVSNVVSVNTKTNNWSNIEISERTITDSVEVGGIEYRREVIPVRVSTLAK